MKLFLKIIIFITLIVGLCFVFFYTKDFVLSPETLETDWGKVCINLNCFSVELAETNAEREKGLMYRKELGWGNGMLFIFDKEGVYPFWMKNTLIPLDIIWIDKNYTVVFINKNSQPCGVGDCQSINSDVNAQYVLEINAGLCDNLGINMGDVVTFEIK